MTGTYRLSNPSRRSVYDMNSRGQRSIFRSNADVGLTANRQGMSSLTSWRIRIRPYPF